MLQRPSNGLILVCFLQAAPGVELYQFVTLPAGSWGWQLISNAAQPRFYKAGSKLMLEVEAGDIDTVADEKLCTVAKVSTRCVSFTANKSMWALKFPDSATYTTFMRELEVCPELAYVDLMQQMAVVLSSLHAGHSRIRAHETLLYYLSGLVE